VTDQQVKDRVAAWYLENWDAAYGSRREQILSGELASRGGLTPRGFLGAEHLAHHIQEAPVWIFAVLRGAADAASPRAGSSIYGAVQQLCLAARAYGIGTSLTTLYAGHEEELRELLGLPADALAMALIPMGYPAKGRWAQPKRRPVEDVVHWNRWDAKRSRARPDESPNLAEATMTRFGEVGGVELDLPPKDATPRAVELPE